MNEREVTRVEYKLMCMTRERDELMQENGRLKEEVRVLQLKVDELDEMANKHPTDYNQLC